MRRQHIAALKPRHTAAAESLLNRLRRQHITALKPRRTAAAESLLNRLRRQHITALKLRRTAAVESLLTDCSGNTLLHGSNCTEARKAKQHRRGREICAYSAVVTLCKLITAPPRAGNMRLFSGVYAVQTHNSTAARRLAPTQNKSRALQTHKAQSALLVYAFKRRWSKCLSLSPQARRGAPSRCRAR